MEKNIVRQHKIQHDKAVILLIKKYEEGKQRNVRWSQRAFATRLGLSSGALSEILQGKRILSAQLKKKIYKHFFAGRLNIQHALIFLREHIIHHQPQINRLLK